MHSNCIRNQTIIVSYVIKSKCSYYIWLQS